MKKLLVCLIVLISRYSFVHSQTVPNDTIASVEARALYEFVLGNYEKAIREFRKVLSVDSSRIKSYLGLGNCYLIQEENERARKYFIQAAFMDSTNPEIYYNIGLTYQQEKEYEQAEKYYKMALKLKPFHVFSNNNLAFVYAEQGANLDLALNLIRRAIEHTTPVPPEFYDTQGWIYFKLGRYRDAMNYIEKAHRMAPHNEEIREHFKQVSKRLGKG